MQSVARCSRGIRVLAILSLATLAASVAPRAASAGPLLTKALAYSANWQERHGTGFGCRVETVWSDASQTVPVRYEDIGDAVGWTGPYVAAEAMRWYLTRDPEAKANGYRGLECLIAAESVTGKPGFIGRNVSPYEGAFAAYVGPVCDDAHNCHLVTEGPYAGSYWLGNTSSDTYIGWFQGILFAWDMLLDEPGDAAAREQVRGVVERVLDTLIADGYLIIEPDGSLSDSAPEIIGNERIAFHGVAARVVGGRFTDMIPQVWAENLITYIFSTWAPFNTHFQYFAYHLGHSLQHMLLYMETVPAYLDLHRYLTRENLYQWVDHTQQSYFDFVAWGGGVATYTPEDVAADREMLGAVPDPPRLKIQPDQGEWTPDPMVDLLNFLGPIIAELLGIPGGWDPVSPLAMEPFAAGKRCVVGYMWDNNPARICSDSDPLFEYSGDDFLIAYWTGRYYGILTEAD